MSKTPRRSISNDMKERKWADFYAWKGEAKECLWRTSFGVTDLDSDVLQTFDLHSGCEGIFFLEEITNWKCVTFHIPVGDTEPHQPLRAHFICYKKAACGNRAKVRKKSRLWWSRKEGGKNEKDRKEKVGEEKGEQSHDNLWLIKAEKKSRGNETSFKETWNLLIHQINPPTFPFSPRSLILFAAYFNIKLTSKPLIAPWEIYFAFFHRENTRFTMMGADGGGM